MTSRQYRAAIKKLGLTLSAAAEYLQISYRTSRRLANIKRKAKVPRLIAFALRIPLRKKMTPERMVEEFGD